MDDNSSKDIINLNEGRAAATHPHEAVDKHHPSSIHSLLNELGHNREMFANVGLGTVRQLQAQELDVQSLIIVRSMSFYFEWST